MAEKKNEFLYMARLAEQTERFEDMVKHMKNYISVTGELRDDERNLLSIAYKNTVSSRRTAWRAISALETKEKNKVYRSILLNLGIKTA
jgi:14-3-3 protein epsilon